MVTRPEDKVNGLRTAVEQMGGELLAVPTLAFEPFGDAEKTNDAIARLDKFEWLLFTSANAVHFFFEHTIADQTLPGATRVGAVGSATHKALQERGLAQQWPSCQRCGLLDGVW